MSNTFAKVWSLWPSLEKMAAALNESPAALRALRDARKLPEDRHTNFLMARAGYVGIKLDRAELQRERMRCRPAEDQERAAARTAIGAVFAQLGGYDVVADALGVSVNSLRCAKTRGRLTHQHALTKFAEERGVAIPETLFK